jgi:hypothetical protein
LLQPMAPWKAGYLASKTKFTAKLLKNPLICGECVTDTPVIFIVSLVDMTDVTLGTSDLWLGTRAETGSTITPA